MPKTPNSRSKPLELTVRVTGTTNDEIRFYRANEKPYGVFSNLFRRAITFEDVEYPTAEHAYQAGKARKEVVRDWILSAPSPSLVAMAAHGLYTWDHATRELRVQTEDLVLVPAWRASHPR